MSRLKVRRARVSRFRLTLALRWQSFFASWLLTRSERRLTKEQKRLTLLLQGSNLTNEPYVAYSEDKQRLLDYQEYGTQYLFGVNYRF